MDNQNAPIGRRYYGGNASNLGLVSRITPITFKQFIDNCLGLPIALNVTRSQYWAMDKKDRQKAKRVPFVTPATWVETEPGMEIRRVNENMEAVALLCVDLDDPVTAMPYYSEPGVLEDQLNPFAFALYRTASSKPDAPRLRLMVDTHGLAPEQYPDAVEDIARRIGLPLKALTRESKQAFMPMFLPTVFADERDNMQDHPLLFVSHVGRRAYTPRDLADSEYSLLGEEPPSAFKREELEPGMDGDPLENLDYLRAPLPGCTIVEVGKALEYVDPDCSYGDWVEIAAALKHQFPHEPDKGKAYELFDKWSARGSKYVGPDDTRAKWGSFSQTPKGRVPVTIRTVMHKASANGWSPATVVDQCVGAVMRWLGEDTNIPQSRWLGVATAKVAAIPKISFAEEEGLLRSMVATAAKRFKIKVTVSALRKDLKAARSLERSKATSGKRKKSLPKWAMNMCYIEATDMFMRTSSKVLFPPNAIEKAFSRELLDFTVDGEAPKSKARPDVRPVEYLLNILQIPTAYDTVYDPTETGVENIIERGGVRYVNTYLANYPEADKAQAPYAKKLFMEHLENVIAEPEYRRVILDFLAYMVQNPGGKIRWAVLMQGAQGCGKTFFYSAMEAVLGEGNAAVVGPESANGQWNDWGVGKQLIALEEIRAVGHSRHDLMNKLKQMLTNTKIGVNQRFRDARVVDNYANYLLFTNHHDAVVLSEDDRRYYVVNARQQTRADVEALGGPEYFEPLFSMLKSHAAGLRHFLLNHEISEDFAPNGTAPRTRYATEMVRDSLSEAEQLLIEALDDHDRGEGVALVTPHVVSTKAFNDLLDLKGINANGSQVGRAMRSQGFFSTGRHKLTDGQRHGLWLRRGSVNGQPPAETARAMAETILHGGEVKPVTTYPDPEEVTEEDIL